MFTHLEFGYVWERSNKDLIGSANIQNLVHFVKINLKLSWWNLGLDLFLPGFQNLESCWLSQGTNK